ncbi:MAG: restriction endonuclease subunit S, partial [Gemmatimonadaceae bacterium]|nr:restriction endonuclease subunit S [Gemmatimonadaceae bacterium]
LNCTRLAVGDVLIARLPNPIGRACVYPDIGQPAITAVDVAILRLDDNLDRRYVTLAINAPSTRSQIEEYGKGATRFRVSTGHLKTVRLPVPPLAEQHRIVAKVDELMALCDQLEAARNEREAARDRLAAASLARLNAPDPDTFQSDARFALNVLPVLSARPDQVRQLRQTILNLAVRGKLVPQDPNEEPASELLRRIQGERELTQGRRNRGRPPVQRSGEAQWSGLPQGWIAAKLGEVASKITDGAHKTPTYVREGVPFVSVKDFSGGRLSLEHTRRIMPAEHSVLYRRCDPRRGDILLGRIGTIGRAVLVETDVEFSLFVSVALIRFDHANVSPIYLRNLLNSPLVESEFNRIKVGGATHTNKLNLGDLRTVRLPIAPLAEQHRIGMKVEQLMALCDQLEASLAAGESARSRLLESVIHEALDSEHATAEVTDATSASSIAKRKRKPSSLRS